MKKQQTKINEKELEKVKNQLVRALADYDNLRKRIERGRYNASLVVDFCGYPVVIVESERWF